MRLSLLALLFAACVAPSQLDPSRYGALHVGLDDGLDGVSAWRPDQVAALRESIPWLSALGPAVTLMTPGEADVVVRPAALGGPCGRYSRGNGFVEVDPACTGGYGALQLAAAHELIHYLTWSRYHWLGHLCTWAVNAPPPAGCNAHVVCVGNDCVLSPGLARVDDGPGFDEAYTGDVADAHPRAEDLALIRRCQSQGCE